MIKFQMDHFARRELGCCICITTAPLKKSLFVARCILVSRAFPKRDGPPLSLHRLPSPQPASKNKSGGGLDPPLPPAPSPASDGLSRLCCAPSHEEEKAGEEGGAKKVVVVVVLVRSLARKDSEYTVVDQVPRNNNSKKSVGEGCLASVRESEPALLVRIVDDKGEPPLGLSSKNSLKNHVGGFPALPRVGELSLHIVVLIIL